MSDYTAIDRFEQKANGNYVMELDDGGQVILFQSKDDYGFWNFCIRDGDSVVWGNAEASDPEQLADEIHFALLSHS